GADRPRRRRRPRAAPRNLRHRHRYRGIRPRPHHLGEDRAPAQDQRARRGARHRVWLPPRFRRGEPGALMPDLLLELFSEEIPARMQRKAAADLQKLVTDALVEAGLTYEGAKGFATPRRLALTVHGLPPRSPDQREERKGPRVGAPDKAIEGFVKAAGLASIE